MRHNFLYVIGGGTFGLLGKRDWQTGKIVQQYLGHDFEVKTLELSPDGSRMVSSADGYRKQSTILWDVKSGKILDRNDNDFWDKLVWHPGGKWLIGRNRKPSWVRIDFETTTKESVQTLHVLVLLLGSNTPIAAPVSHRLEIEVLQMNQVTIDNPLIERLHELVEPVELIDSNGRRLGHFVPTVRADADGCPYGPEELEKMQYEKGGRPLAEIWRSLGVK